MQIILASAKIMHDQLKSMPNVSITTPRFQNEAAAFARDMASYPIETIAEKTADASSFMIGTYEFAVPLGDMIDVAAEIEKAETQLKHLEGFLMGVRKKLSNERFVANAPEAVVALERKKESDSLEKMATLQETIAELKKKL